MRVGPTTLDLPTKLSLFSDHWSPKVISTVNDHNVMLVKAEGEFPWHHHEAEDELFLCIEGEFIVRVEDADGSRRELRLEPGQLAVVPRGVRHQTAADGEASILYLAKQTAKHAEGVEHELVKESFESI